MAKKTYVDDEERENHGVDHQRGGSGGHHHHLYQNQNKQKQLFQVKSSLNQTSTPLGSRSSSLAVSGNQNLSQRSRQNVQGRSGNGNGGDVSGSFEAVLNQLGVAGLTIREMPGDGNCLFRALADQLEGHPRNHLNHRKGVVQYMRDHRPDFEPFVEDDQPFEKYIHSLAQPGTFAGNDAIVAFARLHGVTVVIHQLNSPTWLIHPFQTDEDNYSANGREVHIAYHNGDHYNSVRKIGDESDAPAGIKLGQPQILNSGCSNPNPNKKNENLSSTTSPGLVTVNLNQMPSVDHQKFGIGIGSTTSSSSYEQDPLMYGRRDEDFWVKDVADIDRLVEDVMQQTDYHDANFVRETLIECNFDMMSTVHYILSMSVALSEVEFGQDPASSGNKCELELMDNTKGILENGGDSLSVDIKDQQPSENTDDSSDKKSFNRPESEVSSSTGAKDQPGLPPSPIASTTEQTPSPLEINKSYNQKSSRMSSRQRKDLKKRERKLEAQLRKKDESQKPSANPSPSSHVQALII